MIHSSPGRVVFLDTGTSKITRELFFNCTKSTPSYVDNATNYLNSPPNRIYLGPLTLAVREQHHGSKNGLSNKSVRNVRLSLLPPKSNVARKDSTASTRCASNEDT